MTRIRIHTTMTDGTEFMTDVAPNKPGDSDIDTRRHADKYVDTSRKYNEAVGIASQFVWVSPLHTLWLDYLGSLPQHSFRSLDNLI